MEGRSIIHIFIPIKDKSVGIEFYKDKMGFEKEGYDYYPPFFPKTVSLRLIIVDDGAEYNLDFSKKRFSIFQYEIDRNFLSYCKRLQENGVKFEKVMSDPGGYWGEITDPFGNTFDIKCNNFDEEDTGIEPNDIGLMSYF